MLQYTIRKLISEMRKISVNTIYFRDVKEPIYVSYGKPDDTMYEYSYSYWKNIQRNYQKQYNIDNYVCRRIQVSIPKKLQVQFIMKYCMETKEDWKLLDYCFFLLPEKIMNQFLALHQLDYTRTISDPYYMYVDCLDLN